MDATRMNQDRHGGAAIRLARELGLPLTQILDYSASINPLGAPESALAAAHQALDEIVHYPEIDAASLVAALAEHHALLAANLLAANGSTELIYLLPRILRAKRALIVTPAFSEYEKALLQAGTDVQHFPLTVENNFQFDPDAVLAALDADTGLVIIANPGNPTGAGIDREPLLYLADRLAGRAALVIDEAFVDFAPELSLLSALAGRDNLYILRSMTKFYAIPGLRVGFLAGPAAVIRRMRQALPPWTINTPALRAAIACLQDHDFQQRTRVVIPELRQRLIEDLHKLGLRSFDSVANYLLVQLPDAGVNATALTERLSSVGILIRDCSGFASLGDRYIRLAVRSAGENQRVVAALRQVLAQDD